MLQYLFSILLVLKRHIFKSNISAHIGKLFCIRPILDIRLDLHDLAEALETAVPVLKLLREIDQCPHGIGKYTDVEHKCDKITDIDLTICNKDGSGENDVDLNQCRERAQSRLKASHIMIAVLLGGQKSRISYLKLFLLNLLVGKRLYHADAGEVILNLPVDLRNLHTVLAERTPHFSVQVIRVSKHKRQDDERRQRQKWADIDQDHKRTDDLDRRENNIFRSVVHQLRDVKQIRRDPAHQLPDLLVVIERKG